MPKGDLTAGLFSMGDWELVVVGEVERPWLVALSGGKPMVKCSDLAVDIIDYSSDPRQKKRPVQNSGRSLWRTSMYWLNINPVRPLYAGVHDRVEKKVE